MLQQHGCDTTCLVALFSVQMEWDFCFGRQPEEVSQARWTSDSPRRLHLKLDAALCSGPQPVTGRPQTLGRLWQRWRPRLAKTRQQSMTPGRDCARHQIWHARGQTGSKWRRRCAPSLASHGPTRRRVQSACRKQNSTCVACTTRSLPASSLPTLPQSMCKRTLALPSSLSPPAWPVLCMPRCSVRVATAVPPPLRW